MAFALSWKEVKGSQDQDLLVCFAGTHRSITITKDTPSHETVPGGLQRRSYQEGEITETPSPLPFLPLKTSHPSQPTSWI